VNGPRPERLLTQGEVEREIMRLSDELEDETHRYADVGELVVNAELDYKGAHAASIISAAANSDGTKRTVAERDAWATTETIDLMRTWRIHEARQEATKQSLLSLRNRLDALRTLAANIRAST